MTRCWWILGLTLAFAAPLFSQDARTADSRADAESLRRLYEEQREELRSLREELRHESELRQRQQQLIESLLGKLNDLTGAVSSLKLNKESFPEEKATTASVAAPPAGSDKAASPATSAAQPAATPNPVETSVGKVRFSGLVQTWFAGGDRGFSDTFRIRRGEMRFTGDLMPKVSWSVMFDLAKALSLNTSSGMINGTPVVRTVGVNQAGRVFQEAFITLSHLRRANIQFGQFKIPLGQESLQSTSTLDTPERALFMTDRARGGGLGDVRDLGLMVFGPLTDQFDYQVGIFNGTGESQNDVDANDHKAFVGRFVFKPTAVKGLSIGASGAWAPATENSNPRHDRLGFEAVYQRDRLRLKSELMLGIDGDVHRRGYYAHVGYRFVPKVEGIFRFDMFDPNTRLETTGLTVTERDYITGLNYYIKDHNFKVQFNYIRKTFTRGITPSRNLFVINMQTAW